MHCAANGTSFPLAAIEREKGIFFRPLSVSLFSTFRRWWLSSGPRWVTPWWIPGDEMLVFAFQISGWSFCGRVGGGWWGTFLITAASCASRVIKKIDRKSLASRNLLSSSADRLFHYFGKKKWKLSSVYSNCSGSRIDGQWKGALLLEFQWMNLAGDSFIHLFKIVMIWKLNLSKNVLIYAGGV